MNLEQKVIKIICHVLEVTDGTVNEDTAIGDIQEWNSLGHLAIITGLEEEFLIKFDPEVIMDLEDVGDIVAAIEERLNTN
jgi:acyl carrier protein